MALTYKDASSEDSKDVLQLIQELAAHEGFPCSLSESYIPQYIDHPGCGVLLAKWDKQKEISISTMPENKPAVNLYRSMGFEDEAFFLEKHF